MKLFPSAFFLIVSAVLLLGIAGCSKDSSTEPTMSDEEFFSYVIAGNDQTSRDLFTTDAEALNESDQMKPLLSGPKKWSAPNAAITPLRWGRVIDSVARGLVGPIVKTGDTAATAHVKVTFRGKYVIQGIVGTDTVIVKKPYTEVIERYIKFERIARTRNPRFNWRVSAVSILNGGTTGATHGIQKVEVVTPSETFTVTDPNNYFMAIEKWWIRRLPVFVNIQVTLRVTVTSPAMDAELVALHYLPSTFGLHHTGLTMISETPSANGYTRVFEKSYVLTGFARKYAHVMVSATTKASLYTDTETNFSSVVWGIPYRTSE